MIKEFIRTIDVQRAKKETETLWKKELGQTFSNYIDAARYTVRLMKQHGLDDVEFLTVPADGKTAYQDKIVPLAWKASLGKLTLLNTDFKFDIEKITDPVIADYQRHPFHLIKGSVSTPPEGLKVRIITEEQVYAGEDARGTLVLCGAFTNHNAKFLGCALDAGAIGIISSFVRNRTDKMHSLHWNNACTEGAKNWHVIEGERDFISFCVTPHVGDILRQAITCGHRLEAVALCDGQRYVGEFPMATGMIKGKSEKEFWLLAHLFEPLMNDDSAGVIMGIEIAAAMKRLIKEGILHQPEFTLRLVFASEFSGFAVFSELKKNLRGKVIGALNLDANPLTKMHRKAIFFDYPLPGAPSCARYIMREILPDCMKLFRKRIPFEISFDKGFADDAFLSDFTTGVSTGWLRGESPFWHNSNQTMEFFDDELFSYCAAMNGLAAAKMICSSGKEMRKHAAIALKTAASNINAIAEYIMEQYDAADENKKILWSDEAEEQLLWNMGEELKHIKHFNSLFENSVSAETEEFLNAVTFAAVKKVKKHCALHSRKKYDYGKWLDYSESIIPSREAIGLPADLSRTPKELRQYNISTSFGSFSFLLALMDGRKNLKRIIQETSWAVKDPALYEQTKKYISDVFFLSEHGYLKTEFGKMLHKNDIIKSLKCAGLEKGDNVYVHCAVSGCGLISGGADTIYHALLETIGKNGNLFFPTFTFPFVQFGGRYIFSRKFKPYDKEDYSQIHIGSAPQTFVKHKGVFRSAHPTHSSAGIGPMAEKWLSQEKESDLPVSKNSIFRILKEKKGKVLFFGCDENSFTLFHHIEIINNLPGCEEAVCKIKENDGSLRTIVYRHHLGGHRDFYEPPFGKTKSARILKNSGVVPSEAHAGLGKIKLYDAKAVCECLDAASRKDPNIFLCDDPSCSYCSKHKK